MGLPIPYKAVSIAGICALVIALGAWWGTTLTPADAQTPEGTTTPEATATPTPVPVSLITVTPYKPDEPRTKTVTVSWGTITVSVADLPPIESTEETTDTTTGTSATRSLVTAAPEPINVSFVETQPVRSLQSRVTPQQNDIPHEDIRYYRGENEITWTLSNAQDYPGVTYRIERRYDLLTDPPGGWQLVEERVETLPYTDKLVIPDAVYMYRITPVLTDGSTLVPGMATHLSRPTQILFGLATPEGRAYTIFRAHDSLPAVEQALNVTRYTNRELTADATVMMQQTPFRNNFQVGSHPISPGDIFYYEVELLFRDGAGWKSSGMPIPTIAIRSWAPPTVPSGFEIALDLDDNSLDMSWEVVGDNRQALAYEVQQIQGSRFSDPDDFDLVWESLGTVFVKDATAGVATQYTNKTLPGWHTPRRMYRVIPVGLDGLRSDPEQFSDGSMYPDNNRPACRFTHFDMPRPTSMTILVLYPDVIGHPAIPNSETPRTFDLGGMDSFGYICQQLNPEDFIFQRYFYFKHVRDPSCANDALEESCTVIDLEERPKDNHIGKTIETLTEDRHKGVQWGFQQWRLMEFSDPVLPAGRYGIKYRVCSAGQRSLCSKWRDTGVQNVGITHFPFKGNLPEVENIRIFPSAVTDQFND